MLSLKKQIEQILANSGIEFASFEANEFIKEYYGKIPNSEILNKVQKRASGYPLQYIFGNWEFYGLKFLVGEGVLIPRADTETLVDTALNILKNIENPQVLDLCSGSGCIAVAIEKNSNAKVTAVEKYPEAYEFLQKNIKLNNSKVTPVLADALKFSGKFNMAVSNPPYIETKTLPTLNRDVLCEPVTALDGGTDGLYFYREITKNAPDFLVSGGSLIFEIGYNQSTAVSNILKQNGFCNVNTVYDLGKNPRVVFGTYKGL